MAFSCSLLVEDAADINDKFIVKISPAKMDELKLTNNSLVQIIGQDSKKVICIVQKYEELLDQVSVNDNKILMNRLTRHNLGVLVKDAVTIQPCLYGTVKVGKSISIAINYCEAAKGLNNALCKDLLNQYFADQRILHEGNKFIVRGGMRAAEFVVMKTEPGPYCLVNKNGKTEIKFSLQLQNYKEGERKLSDIAYEDIGGYSPQLSQLRELEFPLRCPSLFKAVKASSPHVIMHGPRGVGKLLMAQAFANETKAHFVLIDESVIDKVSSNISIIRLRNKFEEAKRYSPSVICFNDFETIAPRMMVTEEYKHVIKELVKMIRQLEQDKSAVVLLIGITTQLNQVNSGVLHNFYSTRMDKDIRFENPDILDRLQIIEVHTKNMKLAQDFDQHELVLLTEDYNGADLATLCQRAAIMAKNRNEEYIGVEEEIDQTQSMFTQVISNRDFECALDSMNRDW